VVLLFSDLPDSGSACLAAGVAGAEVDDAATPPAGADSDLFCALLALLRRECGVAGGGDLILGDVGHGCEGSFGAGALSCLRGSFESDSGTVWLWLS
jgi:hypothetical protein